MPGAPCLDGDECPPVEAEEVPTLVRWALPEPWEAAVFGDLLGQGEGGPSEPQAGIESGGTTVVKRYVFGGRVVAMRRGEALYFLSGDHVGSASVTLDEQGRWLADHRFWPYGETKRLDGASESYPTDRLFTGMPFREALGLYRMGARWIDPALGRWASADTLVPNPTDPQSLNRYTWVLNNPLKFRDPSGRMEIYGGFSEPYGDGWYVRINPNAPGCQNDLGSLKEWTSLAVDFTPLLGDFKGLVEAFTGTDLITGEPLGNWRWFGVVGLSELRHADEVMDLGVAIGRVLRGGEWVELGRWTSRAGSMSDAARAYQQYVTGAESGYEFLRNGVLFDGIRMTEAGEAILLDAKSGADFYSKAGSLPFVEKTVLDEAYRQIAAADGLRIQWHIQDYATWEALSDLFFAHDIGGIDLIWTAGP